MSGIMPREKLERYGAENLSDLELLRIVIGSGNQNASAEQIARKLLKLLRTRGSAITFRNCHCFLRDLALFVQLQVLPIPILPVARLLSGH